MENRTFWIIAVVVALVVAAILFQPTVEEQLAPKLETAWVAIQLEDGGVAEVAPVEIEAGRRFTLHAVLGATSRDGQPVYYTDAPSLRLEGRDVPAEQLRRWDRGKPIKLRWYTLEGRWTYLPLDEESGLSAFQYQAFLRSDWPLTWSLPGEVDAANDDHLERSPHMPRQIFGTQRYQVRVELYGMEEDLVPERVIDSWGVETLREKVEEFPTVVALVPGGAANASRVFGLTQLDPPPSPSAEIRSKIGELSKAGIAFSRLTLLRDLTAAAGTTFAEAPWRTLELGGGVPFRTAAEVAADKNIAEGIAAEPAVAPGDLLRVGDRVVVLYEDRGQEGVLDYGDLCFDFVQGAEVRALDEVYSGEGLGLDVEWASLATADPRAP